MDKIPPQRPGKFSNLIWKQMGLWDSWWVANESSLAKTTVPDTELLAAQEAPGEGGTLIRTSNTRGFKEAV